MKRILIVGLLALVQSLFSQDTIFKRNKELIVARILEIGSQEIKYKKWNNTDGPTYSELLYDILKIKYANGTVDTFKVETQTNPVVLSEVPSKSIKNAKYIPFNISNAELLEIIDSSPSGETRDKLRNMHNEMVNYSTYQYLATGLGYGIGFAVPVIVTYGSLTSYDGNYNPFSYIITGAIVGAAIRTTGAVIAKINKNKRLHKKEEIIAICNQLR